MLGLLLQPRVEGVAEAVGDQEDGRAGEDDRPGGAGDVLKRGGVHAAPGGGRRPDAERAWAYVQVTWLGSAQRAATLLAAKGRVSIETPGLATRRGAGGDPSPVGGAVAASSRTQSSSALGSRLLEAKKRAGASTGR
jgi:hypothetical protein